MTDTPAAVVPDAADSKPRALAPPKSPVTDPEAPFGWIKDANAPGGKRPKLRPGKQAKTETPPRERANNKARATTTPKTPSNTAKHAKAVSSLTEGVWMLLAAVPPADLKIPGTKLNVKDLSVRTRAQAEILSDCSDGVVAGFVMMADHSAPVSKFLLKADSESSPVWVLPAMMALLPFVVQSGAMWNSPPAGAVTELAERTTLKLDGLLKMARPQTPQPEGETVEHPNGSAPVPGPEAHSYP